MTDATTADKLAAWQLIEEHGLSVAQTPRGWCCGKTPANVGRDETLSAAVRAWAESAGVPWPAVKVVPMWALDGAIGMHVYDSRIEAEQAAHRNNCRVVPCGVVIRNETEGV